MQKDLCEIQEIGAFQKTVNCETVNYEAVNYEDPLYDLSGCPVFNPFFLQEIKSKVLQVQLELAVKWTRVQCDKLSPITTTPQTLY